MRTIKEESTIIVCPNCNGAGKVSYVRRVALTQDEYCEKTCSYCSGKRVVLRQTKVQDCEVEDLCVNTTLERI